MKKEISREGEGIMAPTHIPTAAENESLSRHTSGPWKVGRAIRSRLMATDQAVEIQDPRDQMVALLYTNNRGGEEDSANARLIAEAPAMREWIAYALDNGIITWPSEVVRARAMLARIDGGETEGRE